MLDLLCIERGLHLPLEFLLSCLFELCGICVVLYAVVLRADLDTWTPSISIRGPFKRAFSRRLKRKLGLALYA